MRMRVTTAMCRARFNRRSPPRLIHAGEAGECGFGPDPSGMGPRSERDCRGHWSDAGLVEELARGAVVEECGHLLGVGRQLMVGSEDSFREPDSLGAGNFGRERLSRVRHAATVAMWPPVSALRASIPRSATRSKAVNALIAAVRSALR